MVEFIRLSMRSGIDKLQNSVFDYISKVAKNEGMKKGLFLFYGVCDIANVHKTPP